MTTEGIDLIGKCFGIMKEISELTHKAMNGHVKFQERRHTGEFTGAGWV